MNKEELVNLYNTLSLIETRGDSTKIMAQCLKFVEQKAQEEEEKYKENAMNAQTIADNAERRM